MSPSLSLLSMQMYVLDIDVLVCISSPAEQHMAYQPHLEAQLPCIQRLQQQCLVNRQSSVQPPQAAKDVSCCEMYSLD